MQTKDLIIVGGGIAGTCLAIEAQKKGMKILLIDSFGQNHSSTVASGLFNPITGRKFVTTWNAVEVFETLHDFYTQIEKELEKRFFHPLPLVRLFPNAKASNDWDSSIPNPFISDDPYELPSYFDEGYGGINVEKGGYLNTISFLQAGRQLIGKDNVLEEEVLDPKDLVLEKNSVKWKDITSRKIVFCEGPQVRQNPFFQWLPFSLTKGELLEIETGFDLEPVIVTKRVFMFPVGKRTALLGATYDREDLELRKTPEARGYLEDRFKLFFKENYSIKQHRVGIRPTVLDRRPIVGKHPKHEQILILNGLGSKGVSLGPFIAQILADHLSEGKLIPEEVNITRFFTFFEG